MLEIYAQIHFSDQQKIKTIKMRHSVKMKPRLVYIFLVDSLF